MSRRIGLVLIRSYQRLISPFLGRNCKYSPTCSEYAYQAVERFGLIRGMKMGAARIARCHPFHEGGYDPVPEQESVA